VPGAPFDIVTVQDVLFHITDDAGFSRAIQNIIKVLKSGGYLIISDGFCTQPWGPFFHEYHRSRSHYYREFNQAGVKVIHIEPIFFTMLTPLCGPVLLRSIVKAEIQLIKKLNSIHFLNWVNILIGIILSMIDLLLGNILRDGPSLKFLIAQKENQNLGSLDL
jgi:SAM-dependent methyltransferase